MKLLASLAVIAAVALSSQNAGAVAIGQIDTFQDQTSDGWFSGGGPIGVPRSLVPVLTTGGPGGAGDAFLEITGLGGQGPRSRITANNDAQWTGNYLAAGVTGIAMDLRNLGNTELTVRLLLENPMGGPPEDEAVTSFRAVLPVGGGWTHAVFPIAPAALTALEGDVTALLSNVTFLRIIQNPLAGDSQPIAGVLGVDNITALVLIPEPSSIALLASAALAGLTAWRRRRQRG